MVKLGEFPKPGTYGTVVLPGIGRHAPGMKTNNGYVIIKGGEAVTLFHGDVTDFIPVVIPKLDLENAEYEICEGWQAE